MTNGDRCLTDQHVRFGVHSGQLHGRYDICLDLAQRAERLGYDWISVIDHFRPHVYGPDHPCFEGTTLLAALAARTERIRCGILVSAVTWRHPAIMANVASTIDHISGGRLEFGIGAGGPDRGYDQYGIEFPPDGTRLDMLDEACTVVRRLWTEESVTFVGKHFQLTNAYLAPPPVQRPIPLVVGGEGERRTLRIAAEHADTWNSLAFDPASYRRKLAAFERHCAAVGRDPGTVRLSATFRAVLVERESDLAARRAELLHGVPDEVRAEYLSFGTPERCIEDLKAYADLGVRDFLLAVRAPIDWRTVELVATRVAPALRAYVSA